MTIEELITLLQSVPNKNIKVLVAADSEGNAFYKLYQTSLEFVVDEKYNGYSLVDDDDNEEDREEVLVFWP
jgi:hypothetical protein